MERRQALGGRRVCAFVAAVAVVSGLAAAPTARAGVAQAELSAASFASPALTERPKYRWWMPLAYTDDDELRDRVA